MSANVLELQPPVSLAWWWWLIVVGLLLVGAALTFIAAWVWRRRPRPTAPDDSFTEVREQALAAVDEALHAPSPRLACQRVVAAVKRFIGTVADTDTDFRSHAQLDAAARRDPRMVPVAQFVAVTLADCFDPAADPDAEHVAERGREVILAWR